MIVFILKLHTLNNKHTNKENFQLLTKTFSVNYFQTFS